MRYRGWGPATSSSTAPAPAYFGQPFSGLQLSGAHLPSSSNICETSRRRPARKGRVCPIRRQPPCFQLHRQLAVDGIDGVAGVQITVEHLLIVVLGMAAPLGLGLAARPHGWISDRSARSIGIAPGAPQSPSIPAIALEQHPMPPLTRPLVAPAYTDTLLLLGLVC